MGATGTKNADRHNSSSGQVETDDDDPYIRGLNSTKHTSKHPRPQAKISNTSTNINSNLNLNYLDAALIDQSKSAVPNPALKLDQYVLGKTEVATDVAKGSLSRCGSAINILKDVAELGQHRSIAHLLTSDGNVLDNKLPTSGSNEFVGSPGSLTWASSSSSSDGETQKLSEPGMHNMGSFADAVYGMPIKRMIKQICVSGLKSSGRHKKPFCLSLTEIRDICRIAQVQFLEEPSLLRLQGDIRVVGDIHGQFKDLMRIFKRGGMPPNQHYLFLGDYVDRGKLSLETIMLLLLLKLRCPQQIHLLRGNHESAGITKVYGFYDECKRRSSIKAWKYIVDVFNTLHIAEIGNQRIF